jgi:hypothetical protein
MVKTIPQLQIKKHLGNSHFRESIPRIVLFYLSTFLPATNEKFGESNQQQQQPLILRVTRIKNPSRNSICQILNFTKEKNQKIKIKSRTTSKLCFTKQKTFTEFVLSNVVM